MDTQTDVKRAPSLEEAVFGMPANPPGQTQARETHITSTRQTEATIGAQPLRFENNGDFLRFLFTRIREKKKWWLLPLLLLLYVLSMFFNIPGKESVLPALYFIF